MPIHDWTRAPSGGFHHFHQRWIGELCDDLNEGVLPEGYFALVELKAIGLTPDVLTYGGPAITSSPGTGGGRLLLAESPPKASHIVQSESQGYTARANRVGVRNAYGELAAVVEFVSPGNKESRAALRSFLEKTTELIQHHVHLLIVDLFPPGKYDPQGIHKAIWDEIEERPFELSPEKQLTVAAYFAGFPHTAYVEPVTVGESLPSLPLFLDDRTYILAPLEKSYDRTWRKCPPQFREKIENPS